MARPNVDTRYAQAVLAFRARFLTEELRRHRGNRAHTARTLGMSRAQLYVAIRKMKIDVPTPGHVPVSA